MGRLTLRNIFGAHVIVITLSCNYVQADEFDDFIVVRNELKANVREKLETIDRDRLILAGHLKGIGSGRGLEGVVQRGLLWSKSAVDVCFFDGTKERFAEVSTIASSWTIGTGIRLNFGSTNEYQLCDGKQVGDIRVSFQGGASYSEVGNKARFLPYDSATLKLGGLGSVGQLSEADKGRILHEFGHALGFEHEHQSPSGGCDAQLNWPWIYNRYGGKKLVDLNMKSFLGAGFLIGLYASAFDPKSVMIYALPRDAFLDADHASCHVDSRSNYLSDTDRATVRMMYPPKTPSSKTAE